MQSMGFCVTMIPAIKRLYSKKEDQAAALKRHLEFFNTQPWIGSTIMGVTAAMEQEKANGEDIDDATISGIKVGLMGPLAGVGDPIFWGTLRSSISSAWSFTCNSWRKSIRTIYFLFWNKFGKSAY